MWNSLQPIILDQFILPLVSIIVTALVGWIAQRIHAWTGKEIEAKHREALQSALTSSISYAVSRIIMEGKVPDLTNPELRQRLLDAAIGYVKNSVPDALKYFNLLTNADITPYVVSKLPVMTEEEALEWNNAAMGINQTEIERY